MTLSPKHIVLLSCLAVTTATASNSDDDLQRALALSMEPQSQGAHQSDHFGRWLRRQPRQFAYHLTPEEEDAQLAAALARSRDAVYDHKPSTPPVESSSYACSSTDTGPAHRTARKRDTSHLTHACKSSKAARSHSTSEDFKDNSKSFDPMDPFSDMPLGPWNTAPEMTSQDEHLPPLDAVLSRFVPSLPALPSDMAQATHDCWDDSLPLARAHSSTQNDITLEELQSIFDDLRLGNLPPSTFFEDEA
ncbi:MAG: hypothetical protein C0514_04725 [Candidatus Puniceispirillum sp.]|nr:hypothetical protein [Candidatus Puniceispirillum sp.]